MSTRSLAAIRGAGALAVWNDIPDELEDEYNNWYTNQHLPERVGIEGFLRGRRFVRLPAATEGCKYFTLYETESIATLSSPLYIDRLNDPTDWTKRMGAACLNVIRTACTVTASAGRGIGGIVTTVEFGARHDEEIALRTWLSDNLLPKLVQEADIVGAHLFESDLGVTSAKDATAEQCAMSSRRSPTVRWFVLIESTTEGGARTALQALAGKELSRHGAEENIAPGIFRLLTALDHR
ncbi:hypothetical protein [Pseudonocardia yunnanensis]|uniref:Uncharacterized protein n=1 Tax=Pseudonocardia yunnanensis TaxID=58107 RepID=A0ABW4EVR7_9PSEU